jgi:long-chain acyl-CoA synthetase
VTEHHPWFESYPPGVPKTLEPYPDISVFGMLEASARRFTNKTAIAWLGRHIRYGKLLAEVERFSAVLASLGVEQGDRVALIMPNCPNYVIAYYATTRLGAVVVGNNFLYTEREMEHQLRDCGAQVVIVVDLVYADFEDVFAKLAIRSVVVARLNDYLAFPKKQLAPALRFKKVQLAQGKPWPPVPRDAPVLWWHRLMRSAGPIPGAPLEAGKEPAGFIYTGGTTGVSKGAMLSHRNLVANAMQSAAWLQLEDGVECVMCALPFFHSFGMVAMNVAILKGAKMVLVPNPRDLHLLLEQMGKEKPTFFPGVPRMFMALNGSERIRKYELRGMKACVSGAAPLPVAVAEKFREVTGGATLVEGYGMTETSPVTHVNPLRGVRKPSCIGLPVPDTECKIVDLSDPDREAEPGERGELCIQGPQVMLGYWNRPEETARTIINGWLHSGDIAVMDQDGWFKIVDRLKEMIIVSGFKVYPTEVEDVLYGYPKILRVCVAGVPDEKTGEAVKAYVVLKEGETATAEEIVTWARDPANGLTGYRVPKLVEFRDSLPETLAGKVLRRVLQEQERQRVAAAKARAMSPLSA